ncbi:GNAT family N-acetyltransferase [Algoriphagus sp. CAU 1675]|uniref:GNAT family N-acetyltransferase n=1 Tax=Algoriphagus sp. CAU 1675 TaxID=3032597 RepID=UPI0023DCE29F|nr:GNAT family N-acetyltransferase [Algoriphagus sp. CAU 1675]MDF2157072.1 GNAT family N-acetyltransferase [Algoriphagus sp. CAU 1675]
MLIREIQPEETWPLRHRVMWPDHPIDFVKIEEDKEGIHYGLFLDENLTSVVSCFESNGEMQFRKFATSLDHQGKGWGSKLLLHLLEEAKKKGCKRVWCNARLEKKGFYERFGMVDTFNRFQKSGKDYTIMEIRF